jgi:hypothetical protein
MCALNLVALQRLMQHFVWLWFVKVKEDGGVRRVVLPPTPLLLWLLDL